MQQDFSKKSLELLYGISQDLAGSLDLHTLLTRILSLSTENVGAERGSIIVLDHDHEPLEAAIIYGHKLLPHSAQHAKETLQQGLAGWVVWNQEAALVPDTSQDVRWMLRPDDSRERSGAKSAICLPLNARDELVGVLTVVHPQPFFFNQEHFDLLQSIADMAGIAINNALLYDTVQNLSNRYRELFEDSIDAIILTDMQGKVVQANRRASATTGIDENELQTINIQDLHTLPKEFKEGNFSAIENGNTLTYESEITGNQAGEHLSIEAHVRKVNIDGANFLQWILRDISERKDVENMREDLTAMVYHDLRSPLSNIITSLELMESMLPDQTDSNLRVVFNIIKRSVDRVQRLVNSILDIQRLEANQPIIRKETVRANEMLKEVAAIVKPGVENKQQNLLMDFDDELPVLKLDEDMFKRVLINLIENAVKYSPQNGTITLGCHADKTNLFIQVDDSGPGIPPESRDIIFEKYSRLQASQFPKGIGLGLAFCRLAVEAHGGKIWVEGKQNGGSRFIISLPIQPII